MAKDINFYFPPELLIECILPRLPVKTLLRFRSVCKSWCSAIDDPGFVSVHLKLSNINGNKKKLVAIERTGHYIVGNVNICRRLTLRISDIFVNCCDESSGEYAYVMSCNGLILVQDVVYWNLQIVNLSIKKSLRIPLCPLAATNSHMVKYLFGFKPSSNDYVVYGFLSEERQFTESISLAVYMLSDNVWRIRNFKMDVPSWICPSVPETMFSGKSVYFDGASHWLGNHNGDDELLVKTHLVSFNFDTEKFSYVELPDIQQGIITKTFRFLFVLGRSLATFSISPQSSCIWVLKNNSWELRLLTFSNAVGFRYINRHPHVISNCFYVEDGNITLLYGNVAYKIMSDKIKHLSTSLSCFVCLDAYVESLVLHKGCPGEIFQSAEFPT